MEYKFSRKNGKNIFIYGWFLNSKCVQKDNFCSFIMIITKKYDLLVITFGRLLIVWLNYWGKAFSIIKFIKMDFFTIIIILLICLIKEMAQDRKFPRYLNKIWFIFYQTMWYIQISTIYLQIELFCLIEKEAQNVCESIYIALYFNKF